ncbi:hypothetical protein [Tenacibaculum xiamenense]|uniref:hypothetical protein n=1 Tax=Tenacibaculum xiamenense TaxID=1261553 RepID=UPI003892EA6A
MKKTIYLCLVFVITVLTACNQNETDEISGYQVDEKSSEVEIIEDLKGNSSNKNIVVGIPPGLYGPSTVNAYEKVTYSYYPTQTALNSIPPNKRGYRITFQVKNQDPSTPDVKWRHMGRFEVGSSTSSMEFPNYGNNNTAKWRIIYAMYRTDAPHWSYSFKKKITVNNN